MLGHDVCPVDDDLATSAITLVRHGDQPSATVRLRPDADGNARQPVAVPIGDVHEWVSEIGNPGNGKGVDRVETPERAVDGEALPLEAARRVDHGLDPTNARLGGHREARERQRVGGRGGHDREGTRPRGRGVPFGPSSDVSAGSATLGA